MVKKHTRRSKRYSRRNHSRKQRGGSPNYGYGGEIIKTGSGAPLEAWSHSDPHCTAASTLRPAPMIGGGCGCMGSPVASVGSAAALQRGGSSGNGGYSMVLSNENGKMFDGIMRGACPPPHGQVGGDPQKGGDPKQLIQSYPAGHGMINPYNSNNANFLDYEAYGRQCMGGGRRNNRKTKNRNRRHR